MTDSRAGRSASEFAGFNVGAVLTAITLAGGLEGILRASEDLVGRLCVDGLNYILQRGFPDTVPLGRPFLNWIFDGLFALTGIGLLTVGYLLGSWLLRSSNPPRDN